MAISLVHPERTIDQMITEIHRQFASAQDAEKKTYRSRIRAGELLNDLRSRIEAGEAGEGVKWWEWYESKFVRSRKDAEKVMALAWSDDPEAKHEEIKAKDRERKRNSPAENVDSAGEEIPKESKACERSRLMNEIHLLCEKMDTDQLMQVHAEARRIYER
jgi:hypothetical protein